MSPLTANHINNNQNDNSNIAEHERRELATVILGTLRKWFQLSSSNQSSLAIHFFIIISLLLSLVWGSHSAVMFTEIQYRVQQWSATAVAAKSIAKCTSLTSLIQSNASINLFIDDKCIFCAYFHSFRTVTWGDSRCVIFNFTIFLLRFSFFDFFDFVQ